VPKTVVELVKFDANDAGYQKVCRFVGRTLDYNDEEGQVTVSPEGVEPPVVADDGDYLMRYKEPYHAEPVLYVCKPVVPKDAVPA
jgi:hypothetical protein